MPEKLWKTVERRICKKHGGKRRGVTGKGESDCIHPWRGIEIKCRKKIPQYLRTWMEQAVVNAEAGKLPLVHWHEPSTLDADDIVFMRFCDFVDWFGNGEEPLPFTDIPRPGEVAQGHG